MVISPHAFACILCSFVLFATSQKAPNIVLLLGDDMGFNDIGYAGSQHQRPRSTRTDC
jgi:hypothetical protein